MSDVGLGMGGSGFKSLIGMPWTLGKQTVTGPAAGAEWSQTVPPGQLWEILEVRYLFVTDATVVNRTINIRMMNGGSVMVQVGNPTYQMGGLTRAYRWMTNFPLFINQVGNANTPNEMQGPLPDKIIVADGDTILSSTGNLQPGDAYSGIDMIFRRYRNVSRLSFL